MLELTFQNALEENIGERGIDRQSIEKAAIVKKIKKRLEITKQNEALNFFKLYEEEIDFSEFQYFYDIWKDMKTIVVCGDTAIVFAIKAMFKALSVPYHNEDPSSKKDQREKKRIYFLDDVDPDYASHLFDILDLHTTAFIVISPTGSHPKTLTYLAYIQDKISAENLQEHLLILTGERASLLYSLALNEGYNYYIIPDDILERFHILSTACFLPLYFTGIEGKKLLVGARRGVRSYTQMNFQNPAIFLASMLFDFAEKKDVKNIVLMSYQKRLHLYTRWLCYYWNDILVQQGKGIRAIPFYGAEDNDLFLENYLQDSDGTIFLIFTPKKFQRRAVVRNFITSMEEIQYIQGTELGEISFFEQGNAVALLRKLDIPQLMLIHADLLEEGMGEITVFFQLLTLYLAILFEIDEITPNLREPSVRFLYGLMGRENYKKHKSVYARLTATFEKYKLRK